MYIYMYKEGIKKIDVFFEARRAMGRKEEKEAGRRRERRHWEQGNNGQVLSPFTNYGFIKALHLAKTRKRIHSAATACHKQARHVAEYM